MGKSSRCPGFRFDPTDTQLAMYYLKKKLLGIKLDPEVIAEINIYDFSPCDLPAKSILSGDLEWYFFCPISKKYSSGPRNNRAAKTGYWKGSGMDREVKYKGRIVAMIKTLIFHMGKSPKGTRTNWVMHEYRMKDEDLANQGVAQEAYVICRVFKKSGLGPKNGAQYGAPFEEKDWDNINGDDDDDDDDDDDERSTVTSSMMVSVLVNPNNVSGSTSTEPGPCPSTTVTSSAVTWAPKTYDPNVSSPGPSTIIYWENERVTDVPVNDDVMLTHDDPASPFQNNNTQEEVEDPKGKKVMTDDGIDILNELVDVSNPHDLSPDMFNMFSVEGFADDSPDAFLIGDLWK